MKKKTYIEPHFAVIALQPTSIIATSDFGSGGGGAPGSGRAPWRGVGEGWDDEW